MGSLIKETVSYDVKPLELTGTSQLHQPLRSIWPSATWVFAPVQGKNPDSLGWNIKIAPRGKHG